MAKGKTIIELPNAADNLTFRQAAEVCGKSLVTIERHNKAEKLPNAFRDANNGHGRWLVPVSDLVSAGLLAASAVVDNREADLASAMSLASQIAVLQAELRARTDEVQFLRGLVAQRGAA